MIVKYLLLTQSQPTTENVPASSRSSHMHTLNPPQPYHSDQHQSSAGPGNGSLDDTRNRTLEHGKTTSKEVEVVEETRYIYIYLPDFSNLMLNFQMLLFFQINSEKESTTNNIAVLLYISRITKCYQYN